METGTPEVEVCIGPPPDDWIVLTYHLPIVAFVSGSADLASVFKQMDAEMRRLALRSSPLATHVLSVELEVDSRGDRWTGRGIPATMAPVSALIGGAGSG